MKQSKILLIGDSCHDRYFFGKCTRLSPEAPVPILSLDRIETRPGMVLNVAENIFGLGLSTIIIAPTVTIFKDRFVDIERMTHLLRVDSGEKESTEKFTIDMLSDVADVSAVVIADYNKGFVSIGDLDNICSWAYARKIPIFIDTKKRDLSALHDCILKLNTDESNNLIALPKKDNYKLIVTMGCLGAKMDGIVYPSKRSQMFDVCGAGDTFMAGLVTSFVGSNDLNESIKFANRCAAVAISHFGTVSITQDEIV